MTQVRFHSWLISVCLVASQLGFCFGQTQAPSPEQLLQKGFPSVAFVLAGRGADVLTGVRTAVVVRENGVLLTAYHVVKNAQSLQVRFKNGDIYDDVQLLGVDPRRDVAAIKISAAKLPALQVADADQSKVGETIAVVSNAAALPWSGSTGIIAAHRVADEVPGAGSGYRLIQFTASIAPGSSGGVVLDSQGRALGIIVGSLTTGQNLNFAVPVQSVIDLADLPTTKVFANGSALKLPRATETASTPLPQAPPATPKAVASTPDAAEKSDGLKEAKDREYILRNFKTMFVDASNAEYFKSDQLKAALARNKGFPALDIRIVDDVKLADVILSVSYTFAWEYPFQLKHQNTSIVVLAGKGIGPLSGPVGAASVAREFVKLARPYRPK